MLQWPKRKYPTVESETQTNKDFEAGTSIYLILQNLQYYRVDSEEQVLLSLYPFKNQQLWVAIIHAVSQHDELTSGVFKTTAKDWSSQATKIRTKM